MSAEGLVKRIAEKWADEYCDLDSKYSINQVVESAIREALLEMAEILEAESRDEKYNQITAITYHTAAQKVREEAEREEQ